MTYSDLRPCLQSRKDSHIKTFENQALALRRELEELIKKGDSEFCCEVPTERCLPQHKDEMTQQDVVNLVVREFERVLQNHRERDAKWYNDGMLSSQCACRLVSHVLGSIAVTQCVGWTDGKYRSAVIEMLSMKDNAKAVPRLSKVQRRVVAALAFVQCLLAGEG